MNKQLKALTAAMGLGMVLATGVAQAESTYGYNAAGAGVVTATARVTVTVAVPKLILLRVGVSGATVDTLAFTGTLTGGIIPGGVAPVDGINLPSGWDGTAPTFATPAVQTLRAYAWTNSSGGGSLGLATVENTSVAGITPAAITVVATAVAGSLPIHPGTTASGAFPTTFTRNVLHSADWAYGISAATLAGAATGTYSQTTTYTATSI